MAWTFDSCTSHSSNYVITSTPSVPCSSAYTNDKCESYCANDSGYFTQLKAVSTKPSVVSKNVDIPPLNFEISDQLHTQLNSCAVFADSSTDYINQSLDNTDYESRLRLSDVADVYPEPDALDPLTNSVYNVPEERSCLRHFSSGSLLKDDPVAVQQPLHSSGSSYIDFISDLSCIPHVVTLILHHVSDGDLCRMSCVSHSWKRAISGDRVSRERRLHYLERKAMNKENIKIKNCVARTKTSAGRPLRSVQTTSDDHISKTCVDSSLQRCRRYWEVGSTLVHGERLRKCPRCESPVRTTKYCAVCTSDACNYNICVKCENAYHGATACRPVTRSRDAKQPATIGSRASKKRLERLCR